MAIMPELEKQNKLNTMSSPSTASKDQKNQKQKKMTASALNKKGTNFLRIPDFDEFANLYHDRIHAVLYFLEDLQGKFTIITNMVDRSLDRQKEVLIYAGTQMQRQILEEYGDDFESRNQAKDTFWNTLDKAELEPGMPGLETYRFFNNFKEGNLSFKDIRIGLLGDYFEEIKNVWQAQEEKILEDIFDTSPTSTDCYLSVPIIQFGEFEGVAHIIFEKKDRPKLENADTIRRLVKVFALEYEGMLLDWDVVADNIERKSEIRFEQLQTDEFYITQNPILSELNLVKYYKISDNYLRQRVQLSDDIPVRMLQQYRKTAIITILIDSYSHNISAHSLSTLSWWFRERGDLEANPVEFKRILNALKADGMISQQTVSKLNPLIQFGGRFLSREIAPLFKYLLEKGAFWSAITRQTNFSGKTSSLFSVLWHDFVNNPLYLGTIANSERINRINIHLTLFEKEVHQKRNRFQNKKIILRKDGRLMDGLFALIDLKKVRKAKKTSSDATDLDLELEDRSLFVDIGPLFSVFREELSKYKVFFPGGVVGKHSFFTLLENEIRNVKHYSEEQLAIMERDGLTLNISIHERHVNTSRANKGKEKELFKVGVWIKHPVYIDSGLVVKRLEGLKNDIISEETFQPRLGGANQDKICAAQLMNNEFSTVQDRVTRRDQTYYPWIKSASSPIYGEGVEEVEDFEVSMRTFKRYQDKLEKVYPEGEGYLKKYFHLWKGAPLYEVRPTDRFEWENIARFRLIYLPKRSFHQLGDLKLKGAVRILPKRKIPYDLGAAYREWIRMWSKSDAPYAIEFIEGNTQVGRIVFQGQNLSFWSYDKIREIDSNDPDLVAFKQIENKTKLRIAHGGKYSDEKDVCNYRAHGEFLKNFFQVEKLALAQEIEDRLLYELYEVFITRICVFDKRLLGRVREDKLDFYRDRLLLDFHDEVFSEWEAIKKAGFFQYHFLIIHLSFLERMRDLKGETYGEERITDFIEEQILQGKAIEEVPPNFMLIIVTGRGRTAWWELLKNTDYIRFTSFRSVESLISGTEDAIHMKDDIDLKFNFTKVLLGS